VTYAIKHLSIKEYLWKQIKEVFFLKENFIMRKSKEIDNVENIVPEDNEYDNAGYMILN
jgi:Cu/Ag efflux protein CusF